MMRLADATGRQLVYNNLGQSARQLDAWKEHMALVDEAATRGFRANPLCAANSTMQRFIIPVLFEAVTCYFNGQHPRCLLDLIHLIP